MLDDLMSRDEVYGFRFYQITDVLAISSRYHVWDLSNVSM